MTGAEAIPLSYGQEGLWFLDRLARAGASYNPPLQIVLSGVPAEEPLCAALGDVLDRHQILRTVFHADDAWWSSTSPSPRPPEWPPLQVIPTGVDGVDGLDTEATRCELDLAAGPCCGPGCSCSPAARRTYTRTSSQTRFRRQTRSGGAQ